MPKKKLQDKPSHLAPHVKRPTIIDLERITGFSRGTISRAFKPEASIKPETREKILKVANELGFALHPGARMIRSQRTYRWGLLLPHLENPEYAELVECIDAEARSRGTHLILGLTHYDPKVESAFLRHWAAGEADGVISDVVSWNENQDLYRNLIARRFPFLVLYHAPEGLPVIRKNSLESFCLGMRHLIGLGHVRIGYVGIEDSGAMYANPIKAYKKELKAEGLKLDESLMVFGGNNREAGVAAWDYFKALPDPPTAVLAFNDIIASGIWIGVHNDGLTIPKHLSLIGNDDIPEARLMGLSSISYDRKVLAREAISLLDQKRLNPELAPTVVDLKTDLIVRRSIDRPFKRKS
ncbi:LacI family DNA-binding transcriptional regulator [Cerasicoccus frondis]|uniref:LacI family DNA-binding transcriptional regulator n=1 Tax=Cerasicoccus frondis TaxID=490090 RepID=UPI0028527D50|nr:LacI family DNA-binding transcriptional regulator [Cerasicoccus frondis]